MAFPPHFQEEIRAHVGLVALISRRVKLNRKGREHTGLCPFHNEKTPSFTVNEEKGFYHCFGCGAHGDVITFVMRSENLSFPDAIERLADEAGLQVPASTPEERATAKRNASLYQVMEQACEFFEQSLRSADGREALSYLYDRGLDDNSIARFRLGFAPNTYGALKNKLLGRTPDSDNINLNQLIEAGLLIKSDQGREPYDRFRDRVMFPIADRRGRNIAFGARALGDKEPKYLNSPDTPLFRKGQVLYGMATAFPAARKNERLVVAEGYMDVIALVRAGIEEAVAPLGTALTENQITLLWNFANEPVLCFDGDKAGQRAALRAAERALPHLEPGKSLRFAALPAGEDPDTLIAAGGGATMEEFISTAKPLNQLVWESETAGQRLDTPERLAGLEHRLESRALQIIDKKVRYQYLAAFRQQMSGLRTQNQNFARRPRQGNRQAVSITPNTSSLVSPIPLEAAYRRREQCTLATLVNHWALLDEFAEPLGTLTFCDATLDKLRQEILLLYSQSPGLDSEAAVHHLMETGGPEGIQAVLSPEVYVSAPSARADSDATVARKGLLELIHGLRLDEAQKRYEMQPTDENFARLQECQVNRVQNLRDSV